MSDYSHLINAAVDVYGREHLPSHQPSQHREVVDGSDSDATPKAKVIPLPTSTFGYSRNGNNTWKDLPLLEPVGHNGMRGMPQMLASQSLGGARSFGPIQSSSEFSNKSSSNDGKKKRVTFPIPTRPAPLPPSRPPMSAARSAKRGDHDATNTGAGAEIVKNGGENVQRLSKPNVESEMETVNYLMINLGTKDDSKTQKTTLNARQPTN